MNVISNSRAQTGMNAASSDAFKMRAHQKKISEVKRFEARSVDTSRSERVRAKDKDRYEPGAAANVVESQQMRSAPDQQRYTPHHKVARTRYAEPSRPPRAS